ncbi:DUF4352 domain-containing protein [Leucobacter denitrificans]|uniref:DUF4352 domain-containing protein n=1 Tax=Leucobacter denitrificans TaxID=683042 RepID=A0A7G9S5A3_9MICO|nr:DUF4352 domain-containing protein [Leucobacter denitrificans]QNN63028.1 DUF4352 domain-containing protein [Leucobacter denitrificans]
MTNTPTINTEPPEPAAYQTATVARGKNTIGRIALITAIVGFIFACVPGALIVGWILLPIAFILSLVSFFMKGKKKGLGIAALIISVVGTIVGVIVFMATVATAIDEAFGGGETTAVAPATDGEEAETPADDQGTRESPYPVGTTITQGDWDLTINSVTLDATDAIVAENMLNEAPSEGNQYLMVNATVTYNGEESEGSSPMVSIEYVTAGGNTINSYDNMVVAPESFDLMSPLYNGASTSGNFAFEVPTDTAGEGVLGVRATMLGDKVFVAVQ